MNSTLRIGNAAELTRIFGRWPSFHDAEVISIGLDRRPRSPESCGPTLTALLHVFETTNDIDSEGYFVRQNHVLTELCFTQVDNNRLEFFNHQNALFELEILDIRDRQLESIKFAVCFSGAFGVHASFVCEAIDVVGVTPCTRHGLPMTEELAGVESPTAVQFQPTRSPPMQM